jgi:hypothetical protein
MDETCWHMQVAMLAHKKDHAYTCKVRYGGQVWQPDSEAAML